jgi:GTP-binding protein
LIPADSKDISAEYDVLLDELKRYNPELLDKDRLVAISKADMLDEELMNEMKEMLDDQRAFDGVPYLFISAVSQHNIQLLKDRLWELLDRDGSELSD